MFSTLKRHELESAVALLFAWNVYLHHELAEVREQAEEAMATAEDASNVADEAASNLEELTDTGSVRPSRPAAGPRAQRKPRPLTQAEVDRLGLDRPTPPAKNPKDDLFAPGHVAPSTGRKYLSTEQARSLGLPPAPEDRPLTDEEMGVTKSGAKTAKTPTRPPDGLFFDSPTGRK